MTALPPLQLGPRPLVQQTAQRTDSPTDLRLGTITAVTSYGITVAVAGGALEASHLDSFSPAVGQPVVLQRFQDSWVALGRPVGSGTPTDGGSPGAGMGGTILGGTYTDGGATLASSTGAEVPVPGYSLTFHHPVGHSVIFLVGYSWYSTQNADWIFVHIKEQFSGLTVLDWVEPILSNSFGRYANFQGVAAPSLGGTKRTYYLTMSRLSGTGTTTISKNGQNRGFFIAVDVGDQALVPAV